MKISAAFPSKYIKAADLNGRKITVTIDSVEMANIGDDQDKLVVYFEGKTKGFVLNITNANMITEIAGTEETDEWKGVKIALYPTKVDFQGRRVEAIRVDYPPAAAPAQTTTRPPVTRNSKPPEREPGSDDAPPIDSDDIPW